MPYANNNGVKIYYELEGQGPPLVLVGGATNTLDVWRRAGYTNDLRSAFKLVLVDPRGHGRSDKPHDPSAYGLKMADDVIAVLDSVGTDRAHYFGYSMGGKIGFWLAAYHSGRFLSFVLGGMSPYFSAAEAQQFETNIENRKLLLADPAAFFMQWEKNLGHALSDEQRASFLANDAEALNAMQSSFLSMPPLSDLQLSKVSVPCLILCGDLDHRYRAGAKEACAHIPDSRFVSLPAVDHSPAFRRNDLILPHVKEFLAGGG